MGAKIMGKYMKAKGEVVPEQGKQKLPCNILSAQDWDTQTLSYEELLTSFEKSLRNGKWRHLNPLDKALYRASLWYAKYRGSIVSASLVEKLLALAERLKETKGMKIFKRGFEKALEAYKKYEENGVFTWAPQLKGWLKDPGYIFWLGTMR
ncbi:MAG: hypothetical protein WA977_08875 [Halobacteriota archaeon]